MWALFEEEVEEEYTDVESDGEAAAEIFEVFLVLCTCAEKENF